MKSTAFVKTSGIPEDILSARSRNKRGFLLRQINNFSQFSQHTKRGHFCFLDYLGLIYFRNPNLFSFPQSESQ
jgi:hypothetical protein